MKNNTRNNKWYSFISLYVKKGLRDYDYSKNLIFPKIFFTLKISNIQKIYLTELYLLIFKNSNEIVDIIKNNIMSITNYFLFKQHEDK